MIGDFMSAAAGTFLLFMSAMVVIAYRGGSERAGTGPRHLSTAIVLGFLAAGCNTLYWQVFGQVGVNFGWITVTSLRGWGDYVDVIVKGMAGLSGYYHLKALHAVMSDDERRLWSPIEMPFYPNRRACLRVLARAMSATQRRE